MAYRDDISALGASLLFTMQGADFGQDVIAGSVFLGTSGGDNTQPAICEDAADSFRTTTRTDQSSATTSSPDTDDMFEVTARHAVSGWFMTTDIQQPTCRIIGETATGKSFAMLLGFGNVVTFEVDDDTFNVQVYSDIILQPNRVYHLCMVFEGNAFGNELRCYIDGVKQLEGFPTNRQPGVATLGLRTITEWGDPAGTVQMGGLNFLMVAPVNGHYNMWGWFQDAAAASLSDAIVRDELFEKGALPDTTLAAGTEVVMQTALDLLAVSVRPDSPLCIRVSTVTGDGAIALSADNITFSPLASVHVQYMGTGTLTWTNTNGSDALIGSTPNGGTIVFVTAKTVTVTVKDATTLLPVVGASVRLEATTGGPAVDGTEILFLTTDGVGVAQTTSYAWSGYQPFTARVRKASSAPYYQSKVFAGTITTDGLDVVVLVVPD